MNRSSNAVAVGKNAGAGSRPARCRYLLPGPSIPSAHAIATELFRAYGSLFSFELIEGIDYFDYLNRLKLDVPASNLGYTRTLAIPVAHTIFYEMGLERRGSRGIAESLIRVSIGIEDTADFVADFQQALDV